VFVESDQKARAHTSYLVNASRPYL
jgi:hypothetical protein